MTNGKPNGLQHSDTTRSSSAAPTQAEYEALLYERNMLLELLNNLPYTIYAKDAEGRFIISNAANNQVLGKARSEVIGKSDLDFFPPDLASRYRADELALMQSHETVIHVEEPGIDLTTGKERWVMTTKVITRDEKGNPTALFGIGRDITDRKAQEKKLIESEERYANAIAATNDGIWDWNLVTNDVYFSVRWKQLVGYEDTEVANTFDAFAELVHPEDISGVLEKINSYLAGKTPHFIAEFRMRHKDGSYRWIVSTGSATRDANGNPVRMVGSHRDMTERKYIEEQLLMQSSVLDISPVLIRDMDNTIIYWSAGMVKLYGWTKSEVTSSNKSHNLFETVFPKPLPEIEKELHETGFWTGELIHHTKSGKIITVVSTWILQTDSENQPVSIVEVNNDITAIKEAQAEAHVHQERLQSLIKTIPGVIYRNRLDAEHTMEYLSEYVETLTGYPASDFVDGKVRTLGSLVLPEDLERVRKEARAALAARKPYIIEYRIQRKDGTVRWVSEHGRATFNDSGNALYEECIMFDVTERKEAALRLDDASKISKIGTVSIDFKAQTLTYDDSYYHLIGSSESDLPRTSSFQDFAMRGVIVPEDIPLAAGELQRAAAHKGASYSTEPFEYRIRRRDTNEVRTFFVFKVFVQKDLAGNSVAATITLQDITERKAAEAQIRRGQAQLEEAQQLANIGSYDFDFATNHVSFTDQVKRIAGFDVEKTLSFERFLTVVHPEDKPFDEFMEIVNNGMNFIEQEYRVVRPSGEVRYVLAFGKVTRTRDGSPIKATGSIQDITERKLAEKKIKVSEERIKSMTENVPGMVYRFVLEPQTGKQYFSFVSNGSMALYGMTSDEVVNNPTIITSKMHPEDVAGFAASVQKSAETLTSYHWEGRLMVDEKIKWISAQSRPQLSPEGYIVWDGIVYDTTDRKLAEETLRQTKAQVQNVLDIAPGMIYEYTIDYATGVQAFTFMSARCVELFEKEPEYFIQNNEAMGAMMFAEDLAQVQASIAHALVSQSPTWHGEFRITTPSGKVKWISAQSQTIENNEKSSRSAGVMLDITDRKAGDAERERLNAELKAKLQEISETQSHLIQSEKMSSLGQMVAGVAHELNTPIGFVGSNTQLVQQRFKTIAAQYGKSLEAINAIFAGEHEAAFGKMQEITTAPIGTLNDLNQTLIRTDRLFTGMTAGLEQMTSLVRSMRNFSRLDEADMKRADLNEGLRGCLLMIGHQLKDANVSLTTDYAAIPLVDCYPAQLNQVFLNLIQNAIHVVEGKENAMIHVSTSLENGTVLVRVKDNGSGIPKHVQPKIFDPFFTTKPVGKGTGLGLSICFNIVQKHNGRLYFETEEGVGTTFIVEIPAVDFIGEK
jgi:PAS domain S-box-containing protein